MGKRFSWKKSAMFNTLLITLVICLSVATSTLLEPQSFEPPFQDVDLAGNRIINGHFKTFGTTDVNNNFIRITPDRQSKKGAIWSRKPVAVDDLSAILKFRISGQGKSFFGDGLALWFTDSSYYSEGDLHGNDPNFYGVGIIMDTFKNTERLAQHRDITVLVNDGTQTFEMMTDNVQGCNTNVRYHNDRDDFSVTDASRVKVVLNGATNSLIVEVDARNTGEWSPCVEIPSLSLLPVGWIKKAHVGLTASTGALADNHDVLSLKTYSDSKVMQEEDIKQMESADVRFKFEDNNLKANFERIETALNDLFITVENQDHYIEHELAAVRDHIKTLLKKVEAKEEQSEHRIDDLEEMVKKEVEGSLSARIRTLEIQMKSNVERKMSNIEVSMDRKMNRLESKTTDRMDESSAASAGWKWPFFILVVLMACGTVGLYLFYQNLKKKHIL